MSDKIVVPASGLDIGHSFANWLGRLEAALEELREEYERRLHDVVAHRCLTPEQRRLLYAVAFPDAVDAPAR